jgi:alkylation response protein AidB-like acyl-CoA dehydrogenase
MLQRRVISEALKGRIPTVQADMYKLFQSELGQRVANAALDLMGPAGQLKPGVPGAPLNGRFERSYRYTVVDTIGGGTSEIQKNIIARRGLGLPKNF